MLGCNKTILKGQFIVLNDTTVACIYCNKKFKYYGSSSSLQYHLRHIHPSTTSTSKETDGTYSQDQQFGLEDTILNGQPLKQEKFDPLTDCTVEYEILDCNKTLLNGQFVVLNNRIAICKYCSKQFKYHNSTSSLQYHLKNVHKSITSPSQEIDRARSRKRQWTPGDATSFGQEMTAEKCDQLTNKEKEETYSQQQQLVLNDVMIYKQPIKQEQCDQLADCLVEWITQSCRPVNLVEDLGLQKLIRLVSGDETYELPSSKIINTKVSDLYENQKLKIHSQLENTNHVALTTDYWTGIKNERFFSTTAHFIDEKWNHHSVAVGVCSVEEQHVADAISLGIRSVIDEWMLTNKVTTLGADGTFNVTIAFKQLPFDLMPCIARTLQLSIKKGLEESGVEAILRKCRKIAQHLNRHSANILELKNEYSISLLHNEPLIHDFSSCWNSTFTMIEQFLKQQEALYSMLQKMDQKQGLSWPNEMEMEKLGVLKALLEPCKKMSEIIGGNKYAPCSVVLPCLMYLLKHMKTSEEDPVYITRFKTAFCENLDKQLATSNEKWLKIAVALDPRFKNLKCFKKRERNEIWFDLKAEVEQLMYSTCDGKPINKSSVNTSQLLEFSSESDTDDEKETVDNDANRVVERYKLEPEVDQCDCPLQWWAAHRLEHPLVASLAAKYLSSPASTVPFECLSLVAGHELDGKRTSLGSGDINKLICLHNWLYEQNT